MAEFIWGIICGAFGVLAIIFMMMAWRAFENIRGRPSQDD